MIVVETDLCPQDVAVCNLRRPAAFH